MNSEIIDSYIQLFEYFPKKEFFEFGIKNTITIEKDQAVAEWNDLKTKIRQKSGQLFVRNSGRNGSGNLVLSRLYRDILGIEINYDATNNSKPSQLIQKLTGKRKNKTIFNYQISHVFGNTKNVYCFCAPWNIVFVPKAIDPLTGHESKGVYVDEFQNAFRRMIYEKYSECIDEYNQEMADIYPKIKKWIIQNLDGKDQNSLLKEFKTLEIEKDYDKNTFAPWGKS